MVQRPLAPDTAGHLGEIAAWIEDAQLRLGEPHPGPTVAGMATSTYTVDLSYVIVMRVQDMTRRTNAKEHYELSVIENGPSAAAVRVILARGFGNVLATHSEAFRGFPLRIDGHLVQEDGLTTMASDFRLEAVAITPWSWPGGR